jgi:mono/diheme cytochrome c family protein
MRATDRVHLNSPGGRGSARLSSPKSRRALVKCRIRIAKCGMPNGNSQTFLAPSTQHPAPSSSSYQLPAISYSAALFLLTLLTGCHQDMHDQPRFEPYEETEFFRDGISARQPIAGTVAVGQLQEDEALFTGKQDGQLVEELPVELTARLLERGRDRYTIFCTACHGQWGGGDGMIVQRGLRAPPTFHSERLRNVPVGHFFDVITHGFGAMPPYAVQIKPEDRWAIAAYLRALQRSQAATLDDVPQADRAKLEAEPEQ